MVRYARKRVYWRRFEATDGGALLGVIKGVRSITKLEIARRQLGTALALHLNGHDPVSVHCLACGGCEIAEQLAIDAGGAVFRHFTLESYPSMSEANHKGTRNQFWNAFKHAKKRKGENRNDDELIAEFSGTENNVRLFTGWFDYSMVAHSLPIEAQVFNTWFLALDLTKFGPDIDPGFVERLGSEFPGLSNLSPDGQRRQLQRSIERWKRDRSLLDSKLTDRRPLILS